jgi:hypothetical protein
MGTLGVLASHGKFSAICHLPAYGVESYNKMNWFALRFMPWRGIANGAILMSDLWT